MLLCLSLESHPFPPFLPEAVLSLSHQSHKSCCCLVASVVSNSVQPHRRQPTRLPRPWDSPGKNNGVGCHFFLQCRKVKSESEDAQSYPTLRDPRDCSLPGSSVHGIFQARVLEWGAIAFSNKSSIQILFLQPVFLSGPSSEFLLPIRNTADKGLRGGSSQLLFPFHPFTWAPLVDFLLSLSPEA